MDWRNIDNMKIIKKIAYRLKPLKYIRKIYLLKDGDVGILYNNGEEETLEYHHKYREWETNDYFPWTGRKPHEKKGV